MNTHDQAANDDQAATVDDDLDAGELAALQPIADRMLADVDAYLADRLEPVRTLGRCGHVFDGVPGRYLCDPCEAAAALETRT